MDSCTVLIKVRCSYNMASTHKWHFFVIFAGSALQYVPSLGWVAVPWAVGLLCCGLWGCCAVGCGVVVLWAVGLLCCGLWGCYAVGCGVVVLWAMGLLCCELWGCYAVSCGIAVLRAVGLCCGLWGCAVGYGVVVLWAMGLLCCELWDCCAVGCGVVLWAVTHSDAVVPFRSAPRMTQTQSAMSPKTRAAVCPH